MKNKFIITTLLLSLITQILALPVNISIVGNVDEPGVYVLDSSNRVSQAIQMIELGISPDTSDILTSSTMSEEYELQVDTSLLEKQKIALAERNKNKLNHVLPLEDDEEEVFEAKEISK
jgi:hypothetical protein